MSFIGTSTSIQHHQGSFGVTSPTIIPITIAILSFIQANIKVSVLNSSSTELLKLQNMMTIFGVEKASIQIQQIRRINLTGIINQILNYFLDQGLANYSLLPVFIRYMS